MTVDLAENRDANAIPVIAIGLILLCTFITILITYSYIHCAVNRHNGYECPEECEKFVHNSVFITAIIVAMAALKLSEAYVYGYYTRFDHILTLGIYAAAIILLLCSFVNFNTSHYWIMSAGYCISSSLLMICGGFIIVRTASKVGHVYRRSKMVS